MLEAGTNLDLDDLKAFLSRVAGFMEAGLGIGEVQKIVRTAETLKVDSTAALTIAGRCEGVDSNCSCYFHGRCWFPQYHLFGRRSLRL